MAAINEESIPPEINRPKGASPISYLLTAAVNYDLNSEETTGV